MNNDTPDPVEPEQDGSPTFPVSSKVYDLLRFVAIIALPALGTAYFGLASLLSLPGATEVVGTITIVDTLLGVVVRSLRVSYEKSDARFDGVITATPSNEGATTDLNVRLNPAAIAGKDEVLVKVNK